MDIPITSQELEAAQERAFRKLSKNVRLPGFRTGKIPRRVFEQNYGADAIANQALEDVVPEAYSRAVREHDLEPVNRPKMEFVPGEDGGDARLKATVEVRPEIALGTYKGVEVERDAVAIGDDDVENSLRSLAKDRATLLPADRPAALGDVVTIDFEGKIDGTAFEGGTAKGQMTELQEDRFIPGFAAGIVGMTAGESRDVTATFPDGYTQADLAGKTAVFGIVLHEVKQFELPAVDDAFARSISENSTLDDLRADVRKRLEAILESRIRRVVGGAVLEKLLAAHEYPLPDTLVEREIDQAINDDASQASQAGLPFEAFLKQSGKTEDELREDYRESARSRVKATLLIEAVAKAERIVATPADIAEELGSLARQYGQPVDRIRKALGNNVLSLMDGIVRNKTLDFLIDNAAVTVKEATTTTAS